MTFDLCLLTVLFSDNTTEKKRRSKMQKCLSVLFVLVVLFINNCGGESVRKGTYIASPTGEEESFVPECIVHTDCYPEHTICVSGVCTGEPQPEVLPEEGTGENDNSEENAANNSGEGPWGNPNYNGNDAGSSEDVGDGSDTNSSSASEDAVKENDTATGGDQSDIPIVECLTDVDCDDENECTFDNCVNGQCGNTQLWTDECGGEPDMPDMTCYADSDCDDADTNTLDECVDGVCHNSICETDNGCDDDDVTTTDICWVGECFHAAVDLECYAGDSCDDGNGCTTDYCDKGYCNHVEKDGCKTCETQADCDDGNVCTIDSCADATLTCSNIDKCQYAGSWTKIPCEIDADCKGSGLGEFCVFSQSADSGLCQECSNVSDNLHPCPTGEICKWGIVGEEGNSLSHYHCEKACVSSADCDDGIACTTDSCVSGKCDHLTVDYSEYCVNCGDDDDCYKMELCISGNLQNWTGECIAGKCEMNSTACPIGCSDYALDGCAECKASSDCVDDDNPCTDTSCSGGKCVDIWQVNCNLCSETVACGKVSFCNAEKAGELVEFTGECLDTGVCEVVETSCPKGCTSNKCEYVECMKNIDCKVGQFCNDDNECDWQGDLQCTFQCPADKSFAVIWYGNNQTATIDCNTGVFKISPATLCLWGWQNPVFKYNLWNGGDVWSGGDKAVLSCNDEAIKVTPDPNLGNAGVQIVSFTDLTCAL